MASSSRERGESSNTRERGESSNTRERGEPSSAKTDKPGITNRLGRIMFCYQPTTEDTAQNEDTQPRQTNQNPGNNEVLPGNAALLRTCVQGQNGVIRSMAAGKDRLLYTGSQSTNIQYWNRGKVAGGFPAEKAPNYALLLDKGGRIYVGSSDGKVRVFRVGPEGLPLFIRLGDLPWLEDGMKKKIWKKKMKVMGWSKRRNWQKYPVTCMSFSEVSEDIPTYLYTGSTDCSIKVWSLKDSVIVDCLKKHKKIVNAVAAGCDDRMFSASQDGSVVMWLRKQNGTGTNDISHTVVDTLLSGTVSVNALFLKSTTTGFATAAGGELYAGLSDGRVLVWKERLNFSTSDMETLRCHEDPVFCLAGSPGHLVFSGARNGIICGWSNDGGTKEHTLKLKLDTQGGQINCMVAQEDRKKNKDGNWSCILYTGGQDKTLRTWRIKCNE